AGPKRDQEVAWKINAVRLPAGRPRAVQPEDAKRNGKALAALDHPDQVRIREIVIGLGVANIAMAAADQLGERLDAAGEIAVRHSVRATNHFAREVREMGSRRLPAAFPRVDAGQL